MLAKDVREIYVKLKEGPTVYQEEKHCQMALKVLSETGRKTAFFKAAMIGSTTFYRWVEKYPIFRDCVEIGYVHAREDWEREYEENHNDENWSKKEWEARGARNFSANHEKNIVLDIDPMGSPWQHYQQIMKQAKIGSFNASEIKQLMEAVNVGTRVYEAYELQREVDKMKEDLNTMSQRNGNNIVPINQATKTNYPSL